MIKTQDEIRDDIAVALKMLREENGFTKAQMCEAADCDLKTWNRYESGESAPDVARFIAIFSNLGKNALKTVLNIVYPDTYRNIAPASDIGQLRQAAANYVLNIASDRTVREWAFITFGDHGSNIEPQMQEITMIEHLPMAYRYAIAETVMTFWRLAANRNELLYTDCIMPDVDTFLDGLRKGESAAANHMESYTTGSE